MFLRRLVEIVPRFKDKRQVVDLSQQIEYNVSAYLATITLMNAAVGVATAIIMWLCGVSNPVLWGVIAFLLNFVPIMGPFLGIAIFLFQGPARHTEPMAGRVAGGAVFHCPCD